MADLTCSLRTPFDESRTFELTGSADDCSVMRSVADDGYYAPDVVWFLRRVMQPDWVVLDIGANIGALALVVGSFALRGRVHAFEPAPENHAYLVRNIAANAVDNVDAHAIALSDSTGEAAMSFQADFAAGAHLSTRVAEGEQSTVRTMRLDDWIAESGESRVDLIKLDVEGHELPVLRGAIQTIDRFRPHLLVEVNPITQRRYAEEPVDELWVSLARRYREHYWLRPDGGLSRITSRRHLDLVLRTKGYVDVFLTDRPPVGALQRSRLRARIGGAREMLRLHRAARRPPAGDSASFVVDPAYRLTFDSGPITATPGEALRVAGRLRNDTDVWIGSDFAKHPFSVRHRWLDDSGAVVGESHEPARFPLIGPGEEAAIADDLIVPQHPGRYQVVFSVVQEGFAWHADLDASLAVRIAVTVTT